MSDRANQGVDRGAKGGERPRGSAVRGKSVIKLEAGGAFNERGGDVRHH